VSSRRCGPGRRNVSLCSHVFHRRVWTSGSPTAAFRGFLRDRWTAINACGPVGRLAYLCENHHVLLSTAPVLFSCRPQPLRRSSRRPLPGPVQRVVWHFGDGGHGHVRTRPSRQTVLHKNLRASTLGIPTGHRSNGLRWIPTPIRNLIHATVQTTPTVHEPNAAFQHHRFTGPAHAAKCLDSASAQYIPSPCIAPRARVPAEVWIRRFIVRPTRGVVKARTPGGEWDSSTDRLRRHRRPTCVGARGSSATAHIPAGEPPISSEAFRNTSPYLPGEQLHHSSAKPQCVQAATPNLEATASGITARSRPSRPKTSRVVVEPVRAAHGQGCRPLRVSVVHAVLRIPRNPSEGETTWYGERASFSARPYCPMAGGAPCGSRAAAHPHSVKRPMNLRPHL